MTTEPEIFRFRQFVLDTRRRTLHCGAAPVELSHRGFDVLELLVRERARVVGRDEIIAAVWQGVTVGPNNLTVQISALRRALAECAPDTEFIVTAGGRGYRFIPDVSAEAAGDPEPADAPPLDGPEPSPPRPESASPRAAPVPPRPARRPKLAAAVTLVALVAVVAAAVAWRSGRTQETPPLSIAVMPFHTEAPDHASDWQADEIRDELMTALGHIPLAQVKGRDVVDRQASAARSWAEIGRTLQARYIVEGSVKPGGQRIKAIARLIDAATGTTLVSVTPDPPEASGSAMIDDIVHALASALSVELIKAEATRSLREHSTDPDATGLFFRALAAVTTGDSLAAYQQAQKLLETASRLQPRFPEAWAELAWLLVRKVTTMADPDAEKDDAASRNATTEALNQDPQNATALAARASILWTDGDYAEAESVAQHAVDLEPDNIAGRTALADCTEFRGELEKAASDVVTLLRLAPDSPNESALRLKLAHIRLLQGRIPEALQLTREARAGLPPPASNDNVGQAEFSVLMLIGEYWLGGDRAGAGRIYASYLDTWHHRSVWRIRALYPRPLWGAPGLAAFMDALHAAGMPAYADEHAPGLPPGAPCKPGEFSETPASLPGGETLSTPEVARRLSLTPPPVVLDLGPGVAVVEGGHWLPFGKLNGSAGLDVRKVEERTPLGQREKPVIVMGAGVYECPAFDVARALAASGYTHVAWYRGGEEAWAASGQPSTDRRP